MDSVLKKDFHPIIKIEKLLYTIVIYINIYNLNPIYFYAYFIFFLYFIIQYISFYNEIFDCYFFLVMQ